MDQHSESLLLHVHPDLVMVIRAASQEPVPFMIVYGIRTLEAERAAVASGHSQTMHSRHLESPDGKCRAVDVAQLVFGKPVWGKGHEAHVFGSINDQIQAVAKTLNIPVEWGGDWKTFKDWGHFQLPWKQYP